MHGERAKDHSTTTYVAMDTHKNTISVAMAESGGQNGRSPCRHHDNLALFFMKQGLVAMGSIGRSPCSVAPSLVPTRSGDRIKTDGRDAVTQASLFPLGRKPYPALSTPFIRTAMGPPSRRNHSRIAYEILPPTCKMGPIGPHFACRRSRPF